MKEKEGLQGRRRHAVSCNLASPAPHLTARDRKSTRLNSSHTVISYAVSCLKKKKEGIDRHNYCNRQPLTQTHSHDAPRLDCEKQNSRSSVKTTSRPTSLYCNMDDHPHMYSH